MRSNRIAAACVLVIGWVYSSSPSRDVLQHVERGKIVLQIPAQPLAPGSLQLAASTPFREWTEPEHRASHEGLREVVEEWKRRNGTHQYLVYAKEEWGRPFAWEIVPYQECRTSIGRVVQQIQVLWRAIFGGGAPVSDERDARGTPPQASWSHDLSPEPHDGGAADAFCQEEILERQWVLKGERVVILFNYAPIGIGGERLHFLVVPKAHRTRFTDVPYEEYLETMQLTQHLIAHFERSRPLVTGVYLLHKTGVDAGQTVPHWHLHVIFSTNAAQDVLGKLTVFKNILLGSSPMTQEALAERVSLLRGELLGTP